MYKEQTTAKMFAEPTIKASWNSAYRSMDFWASAERGNIPQGMIKLAREARYFIKKYESFFERVDAALKPEEKDEYSKALILNRALSTALEEWDTIRHALEQRDNNRYKDILFELDTLANEILLPLFDREWLEENGVFTYIHKLFDIRRFAFSRSPLVGAPYAALNAPEAWLAIPHEAGHYIFWNGTETFDEFNKFYRGLQTSVLDVIEKIPEARVSGGHFRRKGRLLQTWLNWLDEIFADVFGTLVAGPAYAWSMQFNLRATLSLRDLYHSHEEPEHPNPFIRPFFHIAALREMARASVGEFASQLMAEANALDISWRSSWFDMSSADEEIDRLPTPDDIGVMSDILTHEVPKITSAILDAKLGKKLHNKTLLQYFTDQVLYNQALHNRRIELARQITEGGKVQVKSPLEKAVAAQTAIIMGTDPVDVHEALGYGGREALPEPDDDLEKNFNEFVENVTGETDPDKQRKAWRRLLGYSLVEQAFHWHTHSHTH